MGKRIELTTVYRPSKSRSSAEEHQPSKLMAAGSNPAATAKSSPEATGKAQKAAKPKKATKVPKKAKDAPRAPVASHTVLKDPVKELARRKALKAAQMRRYRNSPAGKANAARKKAAKK